jgi:hypothetical protein
MSTFSLQVKIKNRTRFSPQVEIRNNDTRNKNQNPLSPQVETKIITRRFRQNQSLFLSPQVETKSEPSF